jgi:hypothetical protein
MSSQIQALKFNSKFLELFKLTEFSDDSFEFKDILSPIICTLDSCPADVTE